MYASVIQPAVQPSRIGLPAAVRKTGGVLLNQQCWCWGRDIRYAAGNLLLRYGFERYRVPEGKQGSSVYTAELAAGCAVVVWGWGLWWSDGGAQSVYLPRQTLRPSLMNVSSPPSSVWSLADLPPCHAPRSCQDWRRVRELLHTNALWISRYESWVIEAVGLPYRAECVAGWRKTRIAAEQMTQHWQELASHYTS